MKNKNKYVIKQVEEGYEDPDEALRKEAKRRLEEAKKPFNPLDIVTMKNIGILLIWLIIYKIFLYFGFGLVYFFITIIYIIFSNKRFITENFINCFRCNDKNTNRSSFN